MRIAFRFLAPLALASAIHLPAHAADYDPPMVIEQEEYLEEVVPVEIGSGWYLRGDIGYAVGAVASGSFTNTTFRVPTNDYPTANFNNARFSGGISAGVGFGYRFTDYFRSDLMLERGDLNFSGTAAMPGPCPGQAASTTCTDTATATMTNTSLMANAYVDLGTFARFTPYIGAGAGVVLTTYNNASSAYTCVPGAASCAAVPATPGTHEGSTSWRFSYAAMAGIAFDLSKNFKLDVGYKFRHVGAGDMYRFTQFDQNLGANGVQARDPGFISHEVRVGLRYELW